MGPVELPLACRACGESLRGGWDFAPDDLYCGLCGRQVFRVAFREDVTPAGATEPEAWLYAGDGEDLMVHVWGLHGAAGADARAVAVTPDFGDAIGTASFASPEFGTREFTLVFAGRQPGPPASLANPAPCPPQPWSIPGPAVLRLKLVPQGEPVPVARIPPGGAPGRIVLRGPHGTVRAARLLRPVPVPLEFDPPPGDPPPELIGFHDEGNFAEVQLAVTAQARVVVRKIHGDTSGLRGIAPTTAKLRGVSLPCEFAPGRRVHLAVRFKVDPDPEPRQPITIKWELAGFARPVAYACLVTLRPKPKLEIRPNGEPPSEVALGGRPVECDLVLVPAPGAGGTVPEIQGQPELVLDPPGGEWLRAEPFPAVPYALTGHHPVRLTLDTRRLDRAATDRKALTATVRFVDQAGTVWPYVLRTRAVRPRPDDGVLAIDWGTTNTCAAYAESADAPPVALALPPPSWRDDPPDYEQFPSVLYIEDLSDPARPVFHLGPAALGLATRRDRPQCLIHSLKRRFFAGVPVHVQDENGRTHEYDVDELTRLVLLRLVELAEHELGREIRHLGFTFPTKWPAAVRRRFDAVLRRVEADLSAARPHEKVQVYLAPPDIDEANAVALNVLQRLQLAGRLAADRTFTLVAYDFGGGTIDTSVLQVRFDTNSDPPLTTRYLGIGGTGDFGGDEVTRATAELLRDRINGQLDGVRYELPVRRPGDPPEPAAPGGRRPADLERDSDGLRNWERLREMAEAIKKLLCKPPGAAERDHPVRTIVTPRLGQLRCHPIGTETDAKPQSLYALAEVLYPDTRDPFLDNLQFGLADVYTHKMVTGTGTAPFTVLERVRDSFQEIRTQLTDAGNLRADVIALAGGGCRLPLIAELVREHLGPPPDGVEWDHPDRLIYDPQFAKQRVAHGKATYLIIARDGDDLANGLARSVGVLHRPLVVTRTEGIATQRKVVVGVGELIHGPDRPHAFTFTRRHLREEGGHRLMRLSVLSWRGGRWVPGAIGHFDIDAPTPNGPVPPIEGPAEVGAELRLTRPPAADPAAEPEIRLDLTVRLPDGRAFGPLPFVPAVPARELASRLQGEGG